MSTAPNVTELTEDLQPVATAGNDLTTAIGRSPYAGTVTAVTYSPKSDITGAATNHRRFDLINKGQDGNGTTVIASLAFDTGITATDYDEKTITLSATAANRVVAEGDVLAWLSLHIGTGIADPGGLVRVEITRTTTGA